MQPTRLEQALLDWLIEQATDENLKRQLRGCTVTDREHTVVGQYTTLRASPASSPALCGSTVEGPTIDAPGLAVLGGCHLALARGLLDYLEFYSYSDHFPVDPEEFRLLEPEEHRAE